MEHWREVQEGEEDQKKETKVTKRLIDGEEKNK